MEEFGVHPSEDYGRFLDCNPLFAQWLARMLLFLGIDASEEGKSVPFTLFLYVCRSAAAQIHQR